MNEAREDLKKSLRKRKEISIEENDTQYKEMDTTKLFGNGDSHEFDVAVVDLMEKNIIQAKEIRNLKVEKESQAILLCRVIEQKNKVIEDKAMIEDDKRVLTSRLEQKSSEVNMISHMQLETMNQFMIANHEINSKDNEITTLNL